MRDPYQVLGVPSTATRRARSKRPIATWRREIPSPTTITTPRSPTSRSRERVKEINEAYEDGPAPSARPRGRAAATRAAGLRRLRRELRRCRLRKRGLRRRTLRGSSVSAHGHRPGKLLNLAAEELLNALRPTTTPSGTTSEGAICTRRGRLVRGDGATLPDGRADWHGATRHVPTGARHGRGAAQRLPPRTATAPDQPRRAAAGRHMFLRLCGISCCAATRWACPLCFCCI